MPFPARAATFPSLITALVISAPARAQPVQAQPSQAQPLRNHDGAAGGPVPHAAPRLDYTRGPPACPGEEDFRSEVATHTDGLSDYFDPDGAGVAKVWFERAGADYRGSLEYTSPTGQKGAPRTWADASCKVVARAVGSFAANLTRALWDHPNQPPPPPPSPAAPACDPCAAAANKPIAGLRRELDEQRARIEQLEWKIGVQQSALDDLKKHQVRMDFTGWLSAGALITANLTPNVGPGLWLGGDLRSGPLSVGIEARVVLPSRVFVGQTLRHGTLDFDLSQVVALLTPCGRYLYFFGCAVAGAGIHVQHDSNYQPQEQYTDTFPLIQLGGRAGVEVPFGESPVGARAWGEVLYATPHASENFTESRPGMTDAVYHWDRPSVSAFFGLGLVVKLGGKETRSP